MTHRGNHFWLDGIRVDIDRSQLDDNGRLTPIEPKVLEVLRLLAERAGEVVPYEIIAERVWPDVVVAPSSLQRSIALLRKALGDSAKEQRLIVTHPKKGYSLTATVRWPGTETSSVAPEPAAPATPQPGRHPLLLALSLLLLCGVLLLGWHQWPTGDDAPAGFRQINPLTATDASENFVSVSADGRYIAYNRDFDGFDGEIVLKSLENDREWVLTGTVRSLRGPSFSPDGRYLSYASLHSARNQKCSRLNLIDLDKARRDKPATRVLLDCDPDSQGEMVFHSAPTWLSASQLTLVRATRLGSEVVRLDIDSGHQQQLYTSATDGINNLAFSPISRQLAIVTITPHDEPRMVLMDIDHERWRQLPLTLPPGTTELGLWTPSWHPDGDRLIFAANRQLFELGLDGKITPLSMLVLQQLADPHYLPDGKRVVAVQGINDWDIREHRWQDGPLPAARPVDAAPIIEATRVETRHRSNLREHGGQFQPGGEGMAFISNRDGSAQLWFGAGDTRRQLTHFDNAPVDAFVWSPDGQRLIVKAAEQLYLVTLGGELHPLSIAAKPLSLYQWLPDNRLLLGGLRGGQPHLLVHDLSRDLTSSLYQGENYWAQTIGQTTFIARADGQLYRLNDDGPVKLDLLQGTKLQWRFFARNGQLYLQDKRQRFWAYDPASDQARLLHYYHEQSKFITDYDAVADRILTEYRVAAQSEIAMLE